MIRVLALSFGALLSVAVAFLLLRRIDGQSPVDRIAGEALILGPLLPALALYLLSVLSIPWSRALLLGVGLVALLGLAALKRRDTSIAAERIRFERAVPDKLVALSLALLVALMVLGYAQFAYVSAGAENDFIGIWGAKGRTFYEAGRIEWEFLSAPWRAYAHPDYPILVPLVFSAIAVTTGKWSESEFGLVYAVMAAGALLLVQSELRRRTSMSSLTWMGVLAVAPFVMSPWIGLADGPLALTILAALLRMARWLDESGESNLTIGAIFLGLVMSTKNEGIATGIVALLAVGSMTPSSQRRRLLALWPAAAIAIPWLVLRAVKGLSTDLFEGGAFSRLVGRSLDPAYLSALGRYLVEYRTGHWVLYLVFVSVLLVWRKRLGAGGRFVCLVAGTQLLIDLCAYLVTPLPLEWHVRWSWERLVSQIGAVVAVATVSLLVEIVARGSGGGHFPALVGTSPEVENQKPDADADR